MRAQPGSLRIAACAAVLLLLPALALAEEEKSVAELEAEIAAQEDEADRAKGEGFESEQTFNGKLTLGNVVEGRKDIVGLFAIKGRSYPIKLESNGLLKELKAYDRKTVSLQGKFRNQGKYFVVTQIIPPPAPTPRVQKLGGF